MRFSALFITLLLSCFSNFIQAQNGSHVGKEFWASFPHNSSMEIGAWFPTDTPKLSFVIYAEKQTNVILTINGTDYKREFIVPANSYIRTANMPIGVREILGNSAYNAMLYTRPSGFLNGTNSEGIFKTHGIHIVSDEQVNVVQHLYKDAASYSGTLIPVEFWGKKYKVLTPDQLINNRSADDVSYLPRFAFVNIIAHLDNTKVKFVPTDTTRSGLLPNQPIYITLNKGEVYQSLANVSNGSKFLSNDFIGSVIESVENDKGEILPIGVTVGNGSGFIKCPENNYNNGEPIYWENPLFQPLFPTLGWGYQFITTPSIYVQNRVAVMNRNVFRVMPLESSAIVKRNGVVLSNFKNGYYEFISDTPDFIESDVPAQLIQIFSSGNACSIKGNIDPAMVFITPMENGIKYTRTFKYGLNYFENQTLAITLHKNGISSLKVDGKSPVDSSFYIIDHPNIPSYSIVHKYLGYRPTQNYYLKEMWEVTCDSAFNGISYGMANGDAYLVNVGFQYKVEENSNTCFLKTIKSGNISDPGIWNENRLPQPCDSVVVLHDIIIDINVKIKAFTIENGVKVTVSPNVTGFEIGYLWRKRLMNNLLEYNAST